MIIISAYESEIMQVIDVYGVKFWVSKQAYDKNKILLPICLSNGLRRSYTQAGEKDKRILLHRENIAKILKTKTIPAKA